MDCSPPGSSVPEILQTRTLEWVAIPFSRGSSLSRGQIQVSCTAGKFFTAWATRELPNLTLQFTGITSLYLWEDIILPPTVIIYYSFIWIANNFKAICF